MSISYFRRRAAQCFRAARTSIEPHADYESLMRLGHEFKAKATAARERLAAMRGPAATRREAERQDAYADRRE